MKTDLKNGTIIRYRYRTMWEYAKIVEFPKGEKAMQIQAKLPKGTEVIEGVWKGKNRDEFQSRRTFKLKEDYKHYSVDYFKNASKNIPNAEDSMKKIEEVFEKFKGLFQ